MKGVILAGGRGERMLPLTHSLPKALLPLLGATLLEYQMHLLLQAGVEKIYVVVDYLAEKIKDFLKRRFPSVKVLQQKEEGFVGALKSLHGLLKEEVVVCHVDNYISEGLKELVKEGGCTFLLTESRGQPPSVTLLLKEGLILDVREGERLVNTGYYILNKEAEDVLMALCKEPEEEGVVNLIRGLLKKGVKVKGICTKGWRRNINTPSTLLSVAKRLMNEPFSVFLPDNVRASLHLKESLSASFKILPPSWIAEGASMLDAVVGPYAVVGEGVQILSSHVRESILWGRVKIQKEDVEGCIIMEQGRCETF